MSSYSEIYKQKKSGSSSINGLQLRNGVSNQNINHKNNIGFIETEQKQDLLRNNIANNLQLKFNSPNYRLQNPITSLNMPNEVVQKLGKKFNEFSGIDHLAGYPIPEQKRIAKQGVFKSYEKGGPEKQWKPSKKQVENQPINEKIEKIEQNRIKMTDYSERYKRNPIFEGDEVVQNQMIQRLQSRVQKQSSVADQQISKETQNLNNKRLGLDGQSFKRQYKNQESTAERVFSPRRVNLQKNQQIWGESQQAQKQENGQNSNQNQQFQSLKNIKKDIRDFKESIAPEVWPLRSDLPKKKEINSDFVKGQKSLQNTVFHVMHYDYGMPNGNQFTDKINRNIKDNMVDFSGANQQKNFRRTGNVLMKEENMALQRVKSAERADYNKFY